MSCIRRAPLLLASTLLSVWLLGCSSSDSPNGGAAGAGTSVGGTAASAAGASASGGTATSSGGSSPGGDVEPADETGMTAAHNAARAAVNPPANPAIPPLTWSSTVATSAQAWADKCMFMHSGNPLYGENIYAGAGSEATPQQVVDSWAGEAKDYDYATNTCNAGAVCGHYTQVVWRKSTMLGCGVTNCTTNSPFSGFTNWQFWVCEYSPPGNFNGEKPY
jgi:pathogenesis-related protein 1